jgi:hypothetical protein
VVRALAELEEGRVPFTMADLAERAGISRATLYRDAGLRDLVGTKGDGPRARPVDARAHAELSARADALAAERRALRRAVREAEKRAAAAEAQVEKLEAEAARARRAAGGAAAGAAQERIKTEAYAEGFAAGARAAGGGMRGGGGRPGSGTGNLLALAARLPRPALVAARRTLARALHPDLFARDPAAALLATELLKQINAVVGSETAKPP